MSRGQPRPWFRKSRNTYYVKVDGKQVNLYTSDRDEAYRRWHEMMAGQDDQPDWTSQTALAILALHSEWSENHRKPATHRWYQNFLTSFAQSLPRDLAVSRLKPYHVTQWLDANPKWGISGRRGAITAVKRAFNWAVDEGYLPHSPLKTVKRPRAKRRETILSPEQQQLILSEASDQQFRDFLTLIQETGARPHEVRQVEARHVDLVNELWVFPMGEHKTGEKTGKLRVIYLTPTSMEITRRLMAKHPTGPLCRNSVGNPWTSNAVRCRLQRLRQRLSDQLPNDLCCYLFRHTFCTDALQNGVDPVTVAELMGHSDPTMVSRVYQHVGQRVHHMKAAAMKAIGQSASPPSE